MQILAEACVRRGYLNRDWLQAFLHAARYPTPEQLLDQLCPSGPARRRPPRVYANLPAPTYSQFVMRAAAVCRDARWPAPTLVAGADRQPGRDGQDQPGARGRRALPEQRRYARRSTPWSGSAIRIGPGTTNLSVVLDEIARTLDYPGFTQFAHDEKRYEVEQLLRRQKVLLIIDNFETITDDALLDWLLRLPEPSKAIITTREYRREFRSSWPIDLSGMTDTEARR